MEFICGDCYEECEWSDEKLDHLFANQRDPVCRERYTLRGGKPL